MARKRVTPKPTTACSASQRIREYFDVELTNEEQQQVTQCILKATGMTWNYFSVFGIESAQQDVERELGISRYEVTHSQALIYTCKQLGIEYRKYAKNLPKRSIAEFVELAKLKFPHFVSPRSEIVRSAQTQPLHLAWIDWVDEQCACGAERHWLCFDRFEVMDYDSVIAVIVESNEQRKKLLHSIDAEPSRATVKAANEALARIGIGTKSDAARASRRPSPKENSTLTSGEICRPGRKGMPS